MVISNIFYFIVNNLQIAYDLRMNDIVTKDKLEREILKKLLQGVSEQEIIEKLQCDSIDINRVLGCDIFATLSRDTIEKRLKSAALRSVTILQHIQNDETIGANPRIRASEILLSKALELQDLQASELSPATMTQDQLAKRLNDLQSEANKRAKPIDTGVDDMTDMFT